MLTKQQVALAVHRQSVGALVGRRFVGAAGLQEDGSHRVALDPLIGGVVRYVGKHDAPLVPDGAFGPGEAGRQRLDLGSAVEQGVERGVELLDGLFRTFGGKGGQDGEEEGGE